MEVLHHPGECVSARPCAVTIGAYDGVHLAHRQVIERVRREAADLGVASAVVTFDQHPASIVRPESAPKLLTDLDQKIELLGETGVDYVLIVRFDEERAEESATDFVREVLVGCLSTRAVVVGHDFHFGYKRRGNVPLLQEMGAELGFDVTGVTLFSEGPGAQPISSTRIRSLLADGAVKEASLLLGRLHQVRGVVVHGDERGRLLGFPTANLAVPSTIMVPADGVYAGWYIRPGGARLPAALSLGRRPTFYEREDSSLLEAHVLDFDGDLYGEEARVEFADRIRGQARFETVEALVEQMGRDVEECRTLLGV
ncbi:MAG TPA: bifunctional riboflavin kinase/FAD synthetase [Acidimicrobiales bacterium]